MTDRPEPNSRWWPFASRDDLIAALQELRENPR